MILSYNEICELIDQGVIKNATYDMVNPASCDVTLARDILIEEHHYCYCFKPIIDYIISLFKREQLNTIEQQLPYTMEPNEFILASIQQELNLPDDISACFMLKSSPARQGLEQLTACWADAGYNGCMTLELKNMTRYHNLALNEGDPIGQLVFHRHAMVPEDKSYRVRGRYNGDKSVSGIKK